MPKDYIEIKLKKPIDFSSVRFSKKIYIFNEKIKVEHLDDVEISISKRSEIVDVYVEEFFKQLAKDFLDKVSEKDKDIKTEYACNFTDPTICDTYCDTALFFYSFTEVIDGIEIKHMELMFINSKRESTPDPIVCFIHDLEVPLNFKYAEFSPSNNEIFNCGLDNINVTDRYEIDDGYVFNSLVDLSEKLLVELEKQYKVDYGDEKVNLEYTCNFDTPVVYEKICNKAVFTVVRTEKIKDKIIKHLQLVLCKDKQYKREYDDYFVRV